MSGRFLPDKAVDLIDQVCARVHLAATSRPAEIRELEASVAQLKREREDAATLSSSSGRASSKGRSTRRAGSSKPRPTRAKSASHRAAQRSASSTSRRSSRA
ncbi:hypothetical protein OH764_26415 [Burkholderia sp. M6-3]